MKKFSKVMVCFLLIVAMVLPTVGCGKKKRDAVTIDKTTIYKEEEINIEFPQNYNVGGMSIKDGRIYFTATNYEDYDYTKYIWGSVNTDGSDMVSKEVDDSNISWIDRFVPIGNGKAMLFYSVTSGSYSDGGEISIPENPILYTEGNEDAQEAEGNEEASENTERALTEETVTEGASASSTESVALTESDSEETDTEEATNEDEYYDDYQQKYVVDLVDDKCNVLATVDMSEALDVTWIDSVVSLDDGTVLISSGDKMLLLDQDMSVLKKIENLSQYYSFYKLKDGSLIAAYWGEKGREYALFDVNKMAVGDKVEFACDISNYSVLQGSTEYDFYLRDSIQVYGFNKSDAEPKPILNFVNSDIPTSYFDNFTSMGDGTFLGSYYNSEGRIKICKYTKVNPDDIVDKEVLTLGCMWLDNTIREDVINFNKTNDKYRIALKDYSIYQSEDNYSAGQEKFNSDVASGNGPDIILTNDMRTVQNCMSKGLFVDLNKYLDNDPDIDKNDLFPNILKAGSYNGKLYEIIPSFYISTLVGKKSLFNGKTSWTMDEFNQFRKSLPEGMKIIGEDMSRMDVLNQFTAMCADDYIDMSKPACYFDSPEFISLLEFIKELPENNDDYWMNYDYAKEEAAYRDNKTALYFYSMSDIRDYNRILKGTFGEPVTFIGYPVKEGNGSCIQFTSAFAISSKCPDPEAAWQFVKKYLQKDVIKNNYWGIPASMSLFDEMGEEATKKPYYMDGNKKIEYSDTALINGEWVDIDQITSDEVAELKNFIMSVERTGTYHDDILSIIAEDAAPFFEGQKSAEDVVKIIQSRATIYLNEKQ
ncbi:MAG: extracellular solute-binding protein [Lachnospiraceae bacterium]|nr:extracellular solute-binding protein [Lachnospiraceae bacterium]